MSVWCGEDSFQLAMSWVEHAGQAFSQGKDRGFQCFEFTVLWWMQTKGSMRRRLFNSCNDESVFQCPQKMGII